MQGMLAPHKLAGGYFNIECTEFHIRSLD